MSKREGTLTKEVNQDENFSQLRQVYNSLILATWYKKKIKDSILAQVYDDKNKIQGLVIPTKTGIQVEAIYQHYLQAFKKGAYNYIKEDVDPITQESIPRKYFSGGFNLKLDEAMIINSDSRFLGTLDRFHTLIMVLLSKIKMHPPLPQEGETPFRRLVLFGHGDDPNKIEGEIKEFAPIHQLDWRSNPYFTEAHSAKGLRQVLQNLVQHEYYTWRFMPVYYRLYAISGGVQLEFWGPGRHELPKELIDQETNGQDIKWYSGSNRPWYSIIAPSAAIHGGDQHKGVSAMFNDFNKYVKVGWRQFKSGHIIALQFPMKSLVMSSANPPSQAMATLLQTKITQSAYDMAMLDVHHQEEVLLEELIRDFDFNNDQITLLKEIGIDNFAVLISEMEYLIHQAHDLGRDERENIIQRIVQQNSMSTPIVRSNLQILTDKVAQTLPIYVTKYRTLFAQALARYYFVNGLQSLEARKSKVVEKVLAALDQNQKVVVVGPGLQGLFMINRATKGHLYLIDNSPFIVDLLEEFKQLMNGNETIILDSVATQNWALSVPGKVDLVVAERVVHELGRTLRKDSEKMANQEDKVFSWTVIEERQNFFDGVASILADGGEFIIREISYDQSFIERVKSEVAAVKGWSIESISEKLNHGKYETNISIRKNSSGTVDEAMRSDELKTLKKIVGDKIRSARKAIKPDLTQMVLAKEVGVSPHTLDSWETGRAVPVKENHVIALAKVLKLNFDELWNQILVIKREVESQARERKIARGREKIRRSTEDATNSAAQRLWWQRVSDEAMNANEARNKAMSSTGGIDLTRANMNLQTKMDSPDSGGIRFHVDPSQLAQWQDAQGFVPVIIDMEPVVDLGRFLDVS